MMDPLASVSSVRMVSAVAEGVVLKRTWLRISDSQDGRVETYVWNVGQGLSAVEPLGGPRKVVELWVEEVVWCIKTMVGV